MFRHSLRFIHGCGTASTRLRHGRRVQLSGIGVKIKDLVDKLCSAMSQPNSVRGRRTVQHPANDGMSIAAARLVQADTVTDALLAGGAAAAKQPRPGNARFL
jgi:hypothetical protein